jgi:hypothetical protein
MRNSISETERHLIETRGVVVAAAGSTCRAVPITCLSRQRKEELVRRLAVRE